MTTPAFRRLADMVSQELVIKPLVEAALMRGKFPRVFNVVFRDEGKEREPDGWFHPSTHPLMEERQLYYYLTADPKKLIPEEIAYENRMAMIMGTAVHSFIQMVLINAGILVKPTGTCVACGREHGKKKDQCDEWGAVDRTLGRRGHLDGILTLIDSWGRGAFEFKTINPNAAWGLTDHNVTWLKTRHLDYYAQFQDYLDMTGMQKGIILFAVLGFPWKLVEIEVPYDPAFVIGMKAKYTRVRAAEKAGLLPDACCGPLSKQAQACFARDVCPIGRIRS